MLIKFLKSHKQGNKALVFPMILVFFFLSQLSYMGILAIHQDKMRRFSQFEKYYQAKIQEEMVKRQIFQAEDDQYNDFEEAILASKEAMQRGLIQKYPWLSRIDLSQEDRLQVLDKSLLDQKRYIVFRFKLFIDQKHMQACQFFRELNCFGSLDQSGLPVERVASERNQASHLLHPSYQLLKEFSYPYLASWKQRPIQANQDYYFEQGQVHLAYGPDDQSLIMTSQLYEGNFQKQEELSLLSFSYLILWEAQIWQEPALTD